MTDPQTDVHTALANAILEKLTTPGAPVTTSGRVTLIVDTAEELAAQFPEAIGQHVEAVIRQHLNPDEIAELDQYYLPGTIDDAISYAVQS